MERRVCRKCLLREMRDADEAKREELRKIETYRDAIRPTDRASAEEYERRLSLCTACDRLAAGTCMACGCYVELRAAARHARCPGKKW